MAISRDRSGNVHSEVQGKEFLEQDVTALLTGEWHKVRWILLLHMMEEWTDDVKPDTSDGYESFTTLFSVSAVIFKTMKLLKLAREGESEDDACTCSGFMAQVRKLERRSRALPVGSAARRKAVKNMVAVLMDGLKEFGARWSKQWAKPVNYKEALLTTFADKACFIMRRVERLNKVSDTMHEIREVFPLVFSEDVWEEHQSSGKPAQRANPPAKESFDQGGSTW